MSLVSAWLAANWPILAPLLWAVVNEVLAHNPNIAANSLVQLVVGFLKSKAPPAPPAAS